MTHCEDEIISDYAVPNFYLYFTVAPDRNYAQGHSAKCLVAGLVHVDSTHFTYRAVWR
jgi:hypothetical protein